MGRPPVIPVEKKTRIVLSILAGEMTIFMFSPQPGGWLLGSLAGWCDSALFLYGLYSGMKKAPHHAALSMHRMMFVRLGTVLVFVLIGLKLDWGGHRVLFSYLLFYGLLLIQMARKGIGKFPTD